MDPALCAAALRRNWATALGHIGFKVGGVFGKAAAARAGEEMEAQWRALHADLAAGVASIVCMHRDDGAKSPETFRLVIGYDPADRRGDLPRAGRGRRGRAAHEAGRRSSASGR